jgi:hypothetical protein
MRANVCEAFEGERMNRRKLGLVALALAFVGRGALSQRGPATGLSVETQVSAATAFSQARESSVDVLRNPLRNSYFGDMHVHTSWSLDAFANGDLRDDPTVAYRYGRGDAIRNPDGTVRVQIRVPLDFMAVTDHDGFLGETQLCSDPTDAAFETPICRDLRKGAGTAPFMTVYTPLQRDAKRTAEICGTTEPNAANDRCSERVRSLWHQIQKNADAFYQPGKFTTFSAFEWTGTIPKTMGWLHRNVFFLGPNIPEWGGSSAEMKQSPERLWEWLERACAAPCEALAIPHNSNYGNGIMLAPNNSDGTPFTPEVLRRRAKLEPVIEIHQIKGNSECAPGMGTTDEDCGFEQVFAACKPGQVAMCAMPSDYVRNALKTGLSVEEQFGVNPFKYGFVGSTDDHKSAGGSTVERTWPGASFGENGTMTQPAQPNNNPGGLAGVWAEANTREAIFEAIKRRETFATSGTRVRVRFFGGWNYPLDLHRRPTLLREAYKSGVPMGGDLTTAGANPKAPRFIVWATKDPDSANLQRIQIVKGWKDGDTTHERVYDVVCSDGLQPDATTHRCADNRARVSLADCSYSADRGAPELAITWSDPEFRPAMRAFYYARVMENPTCRWSTWRAVDLKTKPPEGVLPVIQERAWSSPIWYTPAGR